ncbi:sulfite exporter TauE/SafE family protein [Halomonas sp. DP8Y7-3]|uniref:sulfite exporter TauE/SafE family protein n=1 Tax=Halomonas sp. DP8Y7-3 TaxID=2859079 RepID=UPI001C986A21|nr:sulfite exporter TauE/SafE family protein [Halomonas sp. DP8Y7-3]MBY5928592.1 sulfite exporter TauE/SafE family protein [Halomonas sp. DP8Y7-3]
MDWLAVLSPLPPLVSLGLILLSGFTSLISASLGVGGGTLLIVTMAQVMPADALIPVHGMVQLGSNGGRLVMSWRHLHWPLLLAFLPGAVVGALVASWLLIRLPTGLLELTIAAFVLYTLWGPGLPKRALGRWGTGIAGAVTTLLSSFVGASGPMVAAFIKQHGNPRQTTVATFAACMTFQHLTKAFVFGAAGFLFADWLALIVAMVAMGVVGTWLGLRLLNRLSEHRFDHGFRLVLTALSLRLVWLGLSRLLA